MSIGGTDVNSRLWNVMLASLVVQALTVGMAAIVRANSRESPACSAPALA